MAYVNTVGVTTPGEDLPRGAYARVADLNRRFDARPGVRDGAIIALAEALRVSRVATTDRRRFEPLAAAFDLHLLPD